MSSKIPDLRFGPGSSGGFTPAGIAAFDNLRPAAVVRELIQNGLDAARNAGVRPAVVNFRLTRTSRNSIPGMQSYSTVFHKAVDRQRNMMGGPLAGQAELIVERIRKALEKPEMDVLMVLDNGIGLNEQRMNALLSDGVSVKEGNATGTYGNGHSTAIPVSDLRYVLYGGISERGKRIASGHAVLASHIEEGDPHLRGGDGFYIRDFRAGHQTLYDYPRNGELPEIITEVLDDIQADSGQGTAVIISAFNNFLEDETLWEMVSHAASANFFVAIEDGDLEVAVEDLRPGSDVARSVVDRNTLWEVLRTHQDKRRTRAFLNGRRAFESHKVYTTGVRHVVSTSAGKIGITLKEDVGGVTRVDLFRNGMWITDRIPGFHQKFTDRVPFQAVLSLNAEQDEELYDFIRIAEGPLHDAIAVKRLPVHQRTACRKALQDIVEWLIDNTRAVTSEQYVSPDFLTLDFGDEDGSRKGQSRNGRFWGTPVPVNRTSGRQLLLFPAEPDPNPVPEPDPRNGPKRQKRKRTPERSRTRPSLPRFFRVASCPLGESRRRIVIECSKDYPNAEFRLVVDEALDATCERHAQDAYTPAVLSKVTIDGKSANGHDLIRWDNEVVGVRLGNLKAGTATQVETDYRLAGDFVDLPNPSLRV